MSTGRVIAVFGPSGVGNDNMVAVLANACPGIQVMRRAISRATGLGGEDYQFATETEFVRRVDQGAFHLHWAATIWSTALRQRFARAPKAANPT